MKKAIYIHRSPESKTLVNILMEPWPEGGLTPRQADEEALALRLWLSEYLPGFIYQKVFDREGLEESPGRIDIPIKRVENLSEIQKGNFFVSIIVPAPIPVKDEARNIVEMKDNPGPLRLRIEIGKKREGEGSGDRLRTAARALVEYGNPIKDSTFSKLFREIEQALEEGEGSEDRLYKIADLLLAYYADNGAEAFRRQFGSLDILGPAKKIVSEGEGNPHPWE